MPICIRTCLGLIGAALAVALLAVQPAAASSAAPGVLWRYSTGGHALIAAPAVGPDGTLYAASSDGFLFAVTADGRRRWSLNVGVTTGQVPLARATVDADGTSYWNVRGSVVAVNGSGHVSWVFLAAGGGSPVLSHDHVLFGSGSYLYAINTRGTLAGHPAWRAAIGPAAVGTGGPSPAVGLNGTSYVSSSDGYLYAIGANGLRQWAFHVGNGALFSPAVGIDGTVYVDTFTAGHGNLFALTPAGHLHWRLTVPAGSDLTRGPDGTIYLASHLLIAVSPQGKVLWRTTIDAAATPATFGSTILVATLQPSLLSFDTRGHRLWQVPLAAPAIASPVVSQTGRIYAGDYTGTLLALAPGVRGSGRIVGGAIPATAVVDLGASNPPFIVRRGRVAWRVTVTRQVERSDNDGRVWYSVLTPGSSTPVGNSGQYRNARYADVAFLAIDQLDHGGLYVGTVGVLGDYLAGGAGGADGGLYYSPDGRGGWQSLNQGLPYTYEPRLRVPTFGLDALVLDPVRHGVLYAQTPVAFGSPGHDAGLYKSTDGGHRWSIASHGLTALFQGNALTGSYRAYPPGALLIDRARTSVLFLVAPTGFFRSDDSAAHWTRVPGVSYVDPASVAVRLGADGFVRVYADRGLFESRDFGVHFRRVHT